MKANSIRQRLMALAAGALILSNSHCGADTVQLSNGDRISGQLQSLDRSGCILTTDFQADLRIPLKRIIVLQTDHAVAVRLNSGERIDGLVNIQFKQGTLQVRSERFGSISLNSEELESLSTRTMTAAPAEDADEKMLASLQGKGSDNRPPSGADASEKVGAEQAEQQEEQQVQRIFLRASGVLLEPGDQQYEISFNYAREGGPESLTGNRVRTFLLPIIGRFGLLPGLEGFLNIPLQYQERRVTTSFVPLKISESSLFSIGDVRAGLKYAFHREDSLPEIIGTFDIRAPTGTVRNPALSVSNFTGTGQWAVAGGINLIKSFDPVILFGGIRYEYDIFDRRGGIKFGPWSNLGYNWGLGFAVNDRVTLIGQFQGNYLSQRSFSGTAVGGTAVGGTSVLGRNILEQTIDGAVIPERELALLSGGFTYKIARNQYIEPSITFGINDVSPDFIIGLSYNRRL
ncbi:MAG: hypothetical protein ACRER2_06490 [Methylococcales bacterium]